ncbi:basic proline-rich protein-like [Sorex araneus]|uniref:basic proline-rich protein-like n=1 Tax=Sorex araneus TaxID=42254 RepID=UPI00243408D3|nr:basic proline-rich protein-like [Sorex araneus]
MPPRALHRAAAAAPLPLRSPAPPAAHWLRAEPPPAPQPRAPPREPPRRPVGPLGARHWAVRPGSRAPAPLIGRRGFIHCPPTVRVHTHAPGARPPRGEWRGGGTGTAPPLVRAAWAPRSPRAGASEPGGSHTLREPEPRSPPAGGIARPGKPPRRRAAAGWLRFPRGPGGCERQAVFGSAARFRLGRSPPGPAPRPVSSSAPRASTPPTSAAPRSASHGFRAGPVRRHASRRPAFSRASRPRASEPSQGPRFFNCVTAAGETAVRNPRTRRPWAAESVRNPAVCLCLQSHLLCSLRSARLRVQPAGCVCRPFCHLPLVNAQIYRTGMDDGQHGDRHA